MQSISSFWFSINNFFRRRDQPPVVKAAPFATQPKTIVQPHVRSIMRSQYVRLQAGQQEQNANYKLTITGPPIIPSEQLEQQELHADLIEEVDELTKSFQKMSVTDVRLKQEDRKHPELLVVTKTKAEKPNLERRREFELKKEYQQDICDYLQFKYRNEKAEYPFIEYQQYKLIRQYWSRRNKGHSQIKVTSFDCVQKLTYKSLGGLDHGEWLNDDVINIYIEMMEKKLIKEIVTPFRILNSYFATSTLQKTQTQIKRVLKKKALDKGHTLVMPINNRNHWYFAVFEAGQIVVHDSMKHAQNYYLDNPIFKNALKFAKMFYEKEYKVVVRMDYPQQDNMYDCGVFMLMGIRDILRKKWEWSFHQGDIRFKRLQIAYEVLEENLIFSDV